MERLPTGIILQILSYMSKEELKVIGYISSKYRSLAGPFIPSYSSLVMGRGETRHFRFDRSPNKNARLSSIVRLLDTEGIRRSQRLVEEIRQIVEITAWWEELILLADEHIPLAVFDNNIKLKLCRLWGPYK